MQYILYGICYMVYNKMRKMGDGVEQLSAFLKRKSQPERAGITAKIVPDWT